VSGPRWQDGKIHIASRDLLPLKTGTSANPFLITDYPQPLFVGTKQEHVVVSAGWNDGAQQGSVSKGPQ
jgi:hypothetical protein